MFEDGAPNTGWNVASALARANALATLARNVEQLQAREDLLRPP
jgi:hypothetical protein